MTVAIVGSVALEGNVESYLWIDEFISGLMDLYGAEKVCVISGGAKGIDSMAIEVALAYGLDYHEYLPYGNNWPAFKARNLIVASEADILIRLVIYKSRTYGSGWTRDRAHERGTPHTERIIVPEQE